MTTPRRAASSAAPATPPIEAPARPDGDGGRPPLVVSIETAARLLDVSRDTIELLLGTGELAVTSIRSRRRIFYDSLLKLIEGGTHSADERTHQASDRRRVATTSVNSQASAGAEAAAPFNETAPAVTGA